MAKISLIQFNASTSKAENIDKAEKYIIESAENGANIVCLQELFNSHYFCYHVNAKYFDLAEPIPGETTQRMQELAKKLGILIIAPIFEKEISGKYFNTAVIISPNGEIQGKYRKSSIPMGITVMDGSNEKAYFTPGDTGFLVFDTPFSIKIGVLICYDRHFPEAARILALKGADVIFATTATAGKTDYLWEIELKAHSIMNVCYMAGVNRVGKDIGGSQLEFYGSSLITNPFGETLTKASNKKDDIVYAEIDTALMGQIRQDWGFFRDRRPDLYGELVK